MARNYSPSQGSDPRSGAINFPAPAPASSTTPSMKFTQLECQLAEIRDSTIRDVQQELRRLKYGIREINMRFDGFTFTYETLDHLRVRVDRHEVELVQKQGRVSFAPAPSSNQQPGNDRSPIPIILGSVVHYLSPLNFLGTLVPIRRRAKLQPTYIDGGK